MTKKLTIDGSTRVLGRWWPLVASCLLATACSMVTVGYDYFPTWAMWQLDSYLSMDTEQRLIANRRLGELHQWHRKAQLPEYREFVKSLSQRTLTTVSPEEAHQVRQRIAGAWQPVADRLAPGMAELLVTLKPEQIERLKQQMATANRKMRKDYLDAREESRVKRVQERIEYFLGDLTTEQQQQLRQLTNGLPSNEELWLAEREARQQRFLTLIERLHKDEPPLAEAQKLCREYLSGMWTSEDPTRKKRLDESARASDRLTATMMTTATAAQQVRFVERMQAWERDFTRMARLEP